MKNAVASWLLLSVTLIAVAPVVGVSAEKRPNFVVVLCDDLGYGDLACYGHKRIQSPNIDRFAAESLTLTNCYAAAPNCSPARTGLMTGRTPYRVGVHNWIPMFSPMHVKKSEITVAALLRQSGYTTCHVGKWHLNGMFNLPGQPQPPDHGFDYWFSTQNNALPTHENPINFVRNGKPVGRLEGYAGQLVADEAITWLTKIRDRERPFFLFVCFHEPHEPIASAKRFRDLYEAPEDSTLPAHHGNVTQMDDAFGRLMKTLDDEQLRENTLVLFTSDNGPAITRRHPHGSSGPLREKKGHVYEGGIRVPGMIRWPGHAKPGTVSDVSVCGVDLLPSLCEIANVPVPTDRKIDGASWVRMLEGKPIARKTPLYWHLVFAPTSPKVAMLEGDWKILAHVEDTPIKPTANISKEVQDVIHHAKLTKFELYNVREDVGETTDLAESEPKRLAELSKKLRTMYREVQQESPVWPDWEWPRYEGKIIQEYYRAQAKRKDAEAKKKK